MSASALPMLILLALLVGVIVTSVVGQTRPERVWALTTGTLAVVVLLAARLLQQVMVGGPVVHELGGWPAPVGIVLAVDALGAFIMVVVAAMTLVVLPFARAAIRREEPTREGVYHAMVLVLVLGLAGMVLTGDLFNLYVFFEISSLAGYSLIAVGDRHAVVASYRYLILGTLGASFYLLGIGFLYMLTGTLNMADAAERIPALASNPALRLSLALVVVGVALKMAIFPMQAWLADAYTHASATSTAIVAPIMTKVSAYVLIRLVGFVYGLELFRDAMPMGTALAWMSAAGILVGSSLALAQRDVKRMLAYSSVAQVSYIGLGIGLAEAWVLVGALLHVVNHAAMKCCLFLVTGEVELATGRRDVSAWAGLGRRFPWTFTAFTLAALSMIGIPPMGGFFSKWYLLTGGLAAGEWLLSFVLVASGLLTAAYLFRLLERVWARPGDDTVEIESFGAAARLPAVVLGVGVLALGLANAWIVVHVIGPALPPGLGMSA